MSSTMLYILLALAVAGVLLLAGLLVALVRAGRAREWEAMAEADRAADAEARVAELTRAQMELSGRLTAMTDMMANRQGELAKTLSDRLDAVTQRVGENLTSGTRATSEQLTKLEARLAVIDAAQKNMGALGEQVTSLKALFANRPARGAFGQGRMEAIVRDALPSSAYSFQFSLSTGKRPDCAIHLPGDARILAVDAKFPLEAYEALRGADSPEAETRATAQLRQDLIKHVKDISEKYLVPGETQDVALLFMPSEAMYAEVHDRFEDVVQRAHRARVLLVSPSLLMMAIQVVQGLVKDAALREQAHAIQKEVQILMDDVRRLAERTGKLKGHFALVTKDFDEIETSTTKIVKRGARIENIEVEAPPGAVPGRPQELPNPVMARVVAAE